MKLANPFNRSYWVYTRRLTVMMMAMIAAGMACLGMYSTHQLRKNVDATAMTDLSNMGNLLAAQLGGAVRWKKADAAEGVLAFLLKDEASGLVSVVVYDNDKTVLFAHDEDNVASSKLEDMVLSVVESGGATFSGKLLLTSYPIPYKGERVGTVGFAWNMGAKHDFIVEKSRVMLWGSVLVTLVMGAIVAWMLARLKRTLGAEPSELAAVAAEVATGNLDLELAIDGNEPTGVYASMVEMHSDLKKRFEKERAEATRNTRLKHALDNVNANLMIADADHRIIFVNKAMTDFFSKREDAFSKRYPGFDLNDLLGKPIDTFHHNASLHRSVVEEATETVSVEVEFEGLVLKVNADPVWSENGERLGTAVAWRDLTAERAVEHELATIVNAANSGDLGQRIETTDKTGFYLVLSEAINELVDVSERVFGDITRVFGALAEGELNQTIDADYQGVFGQLKADGNATVRKLTQVIGQIKEGAEHVNAGASEISQGNTDLARRTEQQGASLEETASSMEEMTGTVKRNAENAAQANDLSINTSTQAERGGDVVGRAVAAMQEINTSSQKINDIIGVIDEIAFQTNLLALNAAVEAARAGEQGRGFAVVAQEVRNLAQRSATAAKEIKALIKDSVSKVETGSKLVDESGETLKEIVASVKKVSEIVAEITAASQEQSLGIDQVNRAISQMDEMTQQNAALVQEAAASSETMSDQAARMHELVTFFKAGGPSLRDQSKQRNCEPRVQVRIAEPERPSAHNEGPGIESDNGRVAV